VSAWAYCPHCGNAKISSFPNNSPLADFFCTSCNEEFELKSQKGKFGTRVVDGAFKTKCERLAASNNPNLFLMNYDLKSLAVVNLFIVPKHFFVREIIEERKPLAITARRAGWIGSNTRIANYAHRIFSFSRRSESTKRNETLFGQETIRCEITS
jgi:type II restriction enzyme